MKLILVTLSLLIMVACASYKPLVPSQSDADRVAKNKPGITLADLNLGKAIFEMKCHKCHSLKRPFTKTEDVIEAVLPKMAKRAKLDSHQEELVLNYLVTMVSAQPSK